MELRQIRYFVAVAEEGNFSAASRRLFISQPPITRQIQQLEMELGVTLFERTRKGVNLTPAGTAFLSEARQILARTRLAAERSKAAAKGEIGTLEIGYFGSPIYSIIPQCIRTFLSHNPKAGVSLLPVSKRKQPDALKGGLIHVGFGRYYPHTPEIDNQTVTQERIVLAVSSTHSRAGKKEMSPAQIKSERMIVFPKTGRPSFADEVIRLLREQGVEPDVEYEASDLSTAMALTAAGLGVCPVPFSVTQLKWPNVSFLRLRKIMAESPVTCIHLADNPSPLLAAFLDSIKKSPPR
ncbi:MAG: LysR family transcriptional regulator [Halieaceae bacterium]|nr:LysR family transcriptional regulator [Halieaceae bacterium]